MSEEQQIKSGNMSEEALEFVDNYVDLTTQSNPPQYLLSCRRITLMIVFSCLSLILSPTFPIQGQTSKSHSTKSTSRTADRLNQQKFTLLVDSAEQSRSSKRFDEAIGYYRQALEIRPEWTEGWWLMSTLLYDQDMYAEAAKGFRTAAMLQPKIGAPWAMLGLCEYELGLYDEALSYIQQSHALGITNNPSLSRVMRYHEGILLNLKGEFETAQQTLMTLSNEDMNSENLIIAHGLSALRLPVLPKEIKPDYPQRELIRRAGWAEHLLAQRNMSDAKQAYERLVADFPKTPNVQYIYGRFLLTQRDDEKAVAAFEREIENSPSHAMARFQIAYIKLNYNQAAAGVPFASDGVKLNPRLPLGHYIYGRLLFDTNQNERAIGELEVARRLAPNDSKIHYALFRAYKRAGRETDAQRAQADFVRLKQIAEGNLGFEPNEPGTKTSQPDTTSPK